MKENIVIWMNMPSHHQSAYFQALSVLANLQVNYTGKQDSRRQNLGWKLPKLKAFEQYNTFFLSQLLTLFKRRQAVHIITGCSSLSNILLWIFCRIFKINWFHLSENVPDGKQRSFFKNMIVRRYYRSVNQYSLGAFAIGNKAQRSFEEMGVSAEQIYLTNYSSPIDKSVSIKSSLSSPLKAIVLGELSQHKGTDIIIDVIDNFTESITVDFFGSVKPENEYLAQKINQFSNAVFHGVIPSDEVNNLWEKYDFLIFPSRIDGWGMAVHEAVANNVPVICSKAAGASEHLIIDQSNGSIINANTTSLSLAITNYVEKPHILLSQSAQCATHKLNFTPEATAKRFIKNISSALSIKCRPVKK